MDEPKATGSRRGRGGHQYRCRAPVAVDTAYGPSMGTCGAWLHRAYIRPGVKRRPVAIGWYCMACHAYIDGDDPLVGVDMEGRISYGDMDDVTAAYYKGH